PEHGTHIAGPRAGPPSGWARSGARRGRAARVMYMATECPALSRPPPTARHVPEGRQDTSSRYVLERRPAPRGTAVIATPGPNRPFDSVTVIARLCVAETAYWPTPRHWLGLGQDTEFIAVNVLGMAPCGRVICVAGCHAPCTSTAPIAANWLADTL